MRQCPICRASYTDEMNFCLNDGSYLENSATAGSLNEKTLSFGKAGAETDPLRSPQPTDSAPETNKKSHTGKIIVGILILVMMISGGFVYTLISAVSRQFQIERTQKNDVSDFNTSTPAATRDIMIGNQKTRDVKVEVIGKVKDNFGENYLKCLVTNASDRVIEKPAVTLILYNNDVKSGSVSGRSSLDYLKPQQTVPIWINLFAAKNFTSARYESEDGFKVTNQDPQKLFPNLILTNTNLSVEKATSLYNNKPYEDQVFVVRGIVENQLYDKISPTIFVLYYDRNDEIVGIENTYPAEMKRGEKSSFEASTSKIGTYGIPVRFEIISINDR